MGRRIVWMLMLMLCPLFFKAHAVSDTVHINPAFMDNYMQQPNLYGWDFVAGDDAIYASREWKGDAKPIASTLFGQNDSLYAQLREGTGWFRVWIRAHAAMLNKNMTFHLVGYGSVDLYMDGSLLASTPTDAHGAKEYVKLDDHPIFFMLTDTLPHLVAIRYENVSKKNKDLDAEWGFLLSIKHSGDLFQETKQSLQGISILLLPVGSTFATLFLVHILMFFFYRKDISNLYFALFNLGVSAFFIFSFIDTVFDIQTGQSLLGSALITISSVLACYSIAAFCHHLFSKKKIFIRIIGFLSGLMAIVTVFFYDSGREYIDMGLAALAVITCLYVVMVFIQALFKKVPGANILGGGILFTIFFIFGSIGIVFLNGGVLIADNMVVASILIAGSFLAVFSIPLSISTFLAWRYAATSRNLQRQLEAVATLSEQTIRQEKEKQLILENQKVELEKEVVVRTLEIVQEKQKSDDLLLNILPHEIAEELKMTGESKPQHYAEASVLFTDLVNFTQMSEKLGVEELLHELNINFTAFDRIMEKYGLEKIKTIGDAYLAVSGLPIPDPAHAHHTVMAALEILDFVEQRKLQVSYGLGIRIGINSGPVIAGIIGVKKFAYDIWGDTVNIAARMEQNSLPGKINVSENIYQLVKNDFECVYRGKISVKGKGEMDMYFLVGGKQ